LAGEQAARLGACLLAWLGWLAGLAGQGWGKL